jgi:hypothetical protein
MVLLRQLGLRIGERLGYDFAGLCLAQGWAAVPSELSSLTGREVTINYHRKSLSFS